MKTRSAILFWLALRNLGREVRRSLLTASAMAVGLALLILSRTLSDGAHEDWIDSGVRLGSGHVAFQDPEFEESGSLDDHLTSSQIQVALDASARLPAEADPISVVRLTAEGLASSPTGAVPVFVIGVEHADELRFSRLGTDPADGRYLQDGDRLQGFIGVRLAERLGLDVGSRMVLTAQALSGDIEGQLIRIAGLFETGLDELDEGLVHIPLETAREWLGMEGGATSVSVFLSHSEHTDRAVAQVTPEASAAGVRVLGWRETHAELDAAVRIDDAGDWVFHGILFAIVALAILNAVLMSVLHRRRELGMLRALGLSSAQAGTVVFTEGVLLTVLAGVVGTILGFALTWLFFRNGLDLSGAFPTDFTFSGIVMNPVIMPVIEMKHLIQSVGFTIAIGLAASLYPAIHAARLDPAESVKFE